MTSETVRYRANIIPYRMILPEDSVCTDPESRTEGMLQAQFDTRLIDASNNINEAFSLEDESARECWLSYKPPE